LGFDTNGAAWPEQRATINIGILRRQREEAQAAQEREYQRQRAERAAEHQRIEAQRLRQQQLAKLREKQVLEDESMKNQQIRWKIRHDSEKLGDILGDYQDDKSATLATYTKGVLVPFAVSFEDSEGDDVTHALKSRERPPPWPRAGRSQRDFKRTNTGNRPITIS
jgi:hypothetical protein